MKYYSEITDTIYNTKEELEEAENKITVETKALEAAYDFAKADYEEAKKKYREAKSEYYEALKKFNDAMMEMHPPKIDITCVNKGGKDFNSLIDSILNLL